METLMPREYYGWARRKVCEANIMLSRYSADAKDGNGLLVSSLAGARDALMYLQSGSPRGPYDVHILRASGQVSSEYERLLSYIDRVMEMVGSLDQKSPMLYSLTASLVSTVEDLVQAAGVLWDLEEPGSTKR